MVYKNRFIFYGIIAVAFLFIILTWIPSLFTGNPYEFERGLVKVNRVYSRSADKIYASVPSGGFYEVKGAKPETFKTFNDALNNHIGFDDKNVYAGNLILKGLDPNKLKVLGNNYYTDGETTYYCSNNSQPNKIGMLAYFFYTLGNSLGITDRAQNYWYPFVELPKYEKYTPQKEGPLATSESKAFYLGQEMPGADPKFIRPITDLRGSTSDRPKLKYFTDEKNMYFENKKLHTQYNSSVRIFPAKTGYPLLSDYLIDYKNGATYANDILLNKKNEHFQFLTFSTNHTNQIFLLSKGKIYFYNDVKEKLESAGKIPFADYSFKEISPDVFVAGDKVYFLRAGESRSRKGPGKSYTEILELKEVSAKDLEKISDVNRNSGSLWRTKSRYFYFDNLGKSQLMQSAIYEFKNLSDAEYFRKSYEVRTGFISEMAESGRLFVPESVLKLKAVTVHSDQFDTDILIIIIISLIPVAILFIFIRKKNLDPFLLEDGYFIFNALVSKKYDLREIRNVAFRIQGDRYGPSGKIWVNLKNGKSSGEYMFIKGLKFFAGEQELRDYIKTLMAELEKHGIKSTLQ